MTREKHTSDVVPERFLEQQQQKNKANKQKRKELRLQDNSQQNAKNIPWLQICSILLKLQTRPLSLPQPTRHARKCTTSEAK